jgi:Holliday junction resolvase RusA-like endonuclease
MKTVSLTIPGEPVAKGRARAFVRGGKVGHYTPNKTAVYEKTVAKISSVAMGGQPQIDGACSLRISFFMPIPKSWSLKKQLLAIAGEIKPTSKPDLDNLIKAVKDGINGVVWRDDSQVVELVAVKKYDQNPRVEVEVVEL